MKNELDSLMKARNLDALMVVGSADHNPPMVYLTGTGHVTGAVLVKKPNETGTLFCNDMEREEAAKAGLKIVTFGTYPYMDILNEAGGDHTLAGAIRLKKMLGDCGITKGRVGLYGHTEVSNILALLERFKEIAPEITIFGEPGDRSLFLYAMETKDEKEITHIRRMGKLTTEVVKRVADYLTNSPVRKDEVLLKEDGTPLTIGDVKSRINLWIAELGAENPEGTIFAIGRDCGVPHSAGTPSDTLRLGQTIIFDIYPCEAGGGYFYDFTRTWSLGYATPEAQKLYDEVKAVYERLQGEFDLNACLKDYQRLTCELFEKNGHPTVMSNPSTQEGYVHSLAHGVGLNIHERPWSGLTAADDNILKPGVVFTSEPGLYYPDKNMGARIEDTYWVNPHGKIEVLAEYPYDFVLEMKNWKKK